MRIFVWLFRGLIFFALFAFALNNQSDASVKWFFGLQWQTPMVIVVLAAFAAGCALGVLAMLPHWWRRRAASRPAESPVSEPTAAPAAPAGPISQPSN